MLKFDYENFNKKGLADIVKRLKKEALPVAEIKGTNKPVRENGFPVKTAEINFESGQKLVIKAKADGGIFQWKLNGKVLAIKNYIQLDQAINEVIALIKENEPNYQKQREKQLAKQKVAVPTIKAVNTTVEEQKQVFQTTLEELTGQNEALNSQIAETTTQSGSKQAELDALNVQIAAENERTKSLEEQLAKAKQGIFESAGDGSGNCCPECGKNINDCQCQSEPTVVRDTKACPQCGATMEQDGNGSWNCPACGCVPGPLCTACGAWLATAEESSTGFKCSNCERECQSDGTAIMESASFDEGVATAWPCFECGAYMELNEASGLDCPSCGLKMENLETYNKKSKASVMMKCPECGAIMDEPTPDEGDCSMVCRDCGCKIGSDGMVMESGCKKDKQGEEGGE